MRLRALGIALLAMVFATIPAAPAHAASNLVLTLDRTAPKWVVKGSPSYEVTATVVNFGDAPADGVRLRSWGADPVPSASCTALGYGCVLAPIPAGGSASVVLRVTDLAWYGQYDVEAYLQRTVPGDQTVDARSWDTWWFHVTDGTVETPRVGFAAWPRTAARGEVVHYFGTLANLGATPLTAGKLGFRASTFQASQAIVGMTISTGAPCAKKSDTSADWWLCPIQQLAPGSKVMVDVTVRFTEPSTAFADMLIQYLPAGYPYFDRDAGADDAQWVSTQLNGGDAADLDVGIAAPAAVPLTVRESVSVTAKNSGPQASRATELTVRVRGPLGFVDLPANCTGDAKLATCALGTLASGATSTVTLPVLGASLGSTSIVADVASSTFDPVDENNHVGAATTVVDAPRPPFEVKPPKASVLLLAKALRTGVPTLVTCPRACTVRAELFLSAKLAKRFGLPVAKGVPTRIGAATKSGPGGAITVRTKVMGKFRARLRHAASPFTVKRITTVTAADGVTRAFTQHITLRVRRR